MERCLYQPGHGFYTSGEGAAGRRRGDFVTSPEVGPLFADVVARVIDQVWADSGRPAEIPVFDVGTGPGTLATGLERADGPSAPARRVHGIDVATVTRLPADLSGAVVVANELLDNLAFRLLERDGSTHGWSEVHVDGELHELLVPVGADTARRAHDLAPDAAEGARIPLQDQAARWLKSALGCLVRGRVAIVDYADTTPSLASRPWREWVRTYRDHGPGAGPLADLGEQDVTCEVAVDQLAHVRRPVSDLTQAEFLSAHGVDELVAEARTEWEARAHVGDLKALRHRSRITEAAALVDPSGLGAFRVLEWTV